MEWLITAILGGCVIIIGILRYIGRRSNYWKERGVPYVDVKLKAGIASTVKMIQGKKSVYDVIQEYYNELEGHPFGGYMQVSTPVLMARDPEVINQFLIKDFSYFEDRGFNVKEDVEPIMANLSNTTGEKWRSLRHKMTPTFTSGKLKAMFEQIAYCSDNILKFIKEKDEPFEARSTMQKFMTNVIGTVSFGLDMDACKEDEATEKFLLLSRKFSDPSVLLTIKFSLKSAFPNFCNFLKIKILDDEVSEFFTKLAKDSVKFREESGERRNDFLQLLIDLRDKDRSGNSTCLIDSKNEKGELEPEDKELLSQLNYAPQSGSEKKFRFTDNSILAESFGFIAAGSETTAIAISFALYYLAVNEHIQRRLQKEIDSVLAQQDFTYSALKEITYLDYFIDEVFRMNPPVGVLMRECTKKYKIPKTDIVIDKGVLISIPVNCLHKDPKYFPDPETFDPERFRDKTHHKGAYFPFGDGPRSCIANRFVLMVIKILIAKLLMNFSVVLSKKTQMPLKMIKKSMFQHVEGGIWVEIKER